MRFRPLLPTFVLCLFALVAVNLAMTHWSQHFPYHQKLESIRTAQDPDLLFVGNSLLDKRIDEAALNRGAALKNAHFHPLNAALGASDAPDQVLLTDYAMQCHPALHALILGFFDFQLTTDTHLAPKDLTGNHMVAVDARFPVSEVAKIYELNSLDQIELRMLRFLPMVANRMNTWKHVELLRRRMSEIGMPHQDTNSMGRAADFALFEASSGASFDSEAQAFIQDPSHFNTNYEQVFADAAQHKLKIVLLAMPMSPTHDTRFYSRTSWQQYMTRLRALAQKRGFIVIDASEWLPEPDQFLDTLHMTPAGASDFSWRLGKELSASLQ